jgi:hypothetical protein
MVLAPYSPGGSESQSEIQRPDTKLHVHDLFSRGNMRDPVAEGGIVVLAIILRCHAK